MYDRHADAALITAIKVGDRAALEHLHEQISGFPCGTGGQWITTAIAIGHRQSIEWMLEKKVDLHFRSDEGFTVLHSCIDRDLADQASIMSALLAAGADPNAKGINDWTPLHMAGMRERSELVRILLSHGADPTIRTVIDDNATAEEECRIHGRIALADLIRTLAADLDDTDVNRHVSR